MCVRACVRVFKVDYDFRDKATFLGYMVRCLLEAKVNPSLIDDKDNHGNKRLELAGSLISLLFEVHFPSLFSCAALPNRI